MGREKERESPEKYERFLKDASRDALVALPRRRVGKKLSEWGGA